MSDFQRNAPLSRGSERSPSPESSSGPTATANGPTKSPSPTSTPTDTPTPTPTKTQTPTPTDTPEPEPTVVGEMFVTTDLNVRTGPGTDTEVVTVLARGTQIGVTDSTDGEWVQVVYDDTAAWVSSDYLSKDEPSEEDEPAEETEEPDDGISSADCESGSGVEDGLTSDAIRVHRAVCAEYPEVDSYGGLRPGDGGEHGTGRAIDIMVSSSSLGDSIAAWVREHYAELGVSEVIWEQRIWTVERADEGWRWMEDRGSATANHYDHVHVTVYGDSGST